MMPILRQTYNLMNQSLFLHVTFAQRQDKRGRYIWEKRLLCALFLDTLKSSSFNPVTRQGNDRCSTGVLYRYPQYRALVRLGSPWYLYIYQRGFLCVARSDWDGHARASECGTSTNKTLHAFFISSHQLYIKNL